MSTEINLVITGHLQQKRFRETAASFRMPAVTTAECSRNSGIQGLLAGGYMQTCWQGARL